MYVFQSDRLDIPDSTDSSINKMLATIFPKLDANIVSKLSQGAKKVLDIIKAINKDYDVNNGDICNSNSSSPSDVIILKRYKIICEMPDLCRLL